MTAMNEFFEMQEDTTTTAPTHREIYYSMGVNTGSTQYINIWRRNDELFIREVCKAFIESVRINKDNNAVHKQFYKEVFQDAQSSLPKPDRKRTGLTHNTYASFVNGIEENFEKGTRNYTLKQWDSVIDITNIAINYFNYMHPNRDPMIPVVATER